MTEDSVAADDNALATLMEMSEATVEEATAALEKSGGNKNKALGVLMRGVITQPAKPSKPSKSAHSKVDDDDDNDNAASVKAPLRPCYVTDESNKKASSNTGA